LDASIVSPWPVTFLAIERDGHILCKPASPDVDGDAEAMEICIILAQALTVLTDTSVDICIQDPMGAYLVVGKVTDGQVREVEGWSAIDAYLLARN
jgi:hypothetical protein